MQDKFSAMEKVTGRVKSQVSKVQSYLSNLDFNPSNGLESDFNGIKKISVLNDKFVELKRKATNELEVADLSIKYLNQFIIILSNYNSYFAKIENDFYRYREKGSYRTTTEVKQIQNVVLKVKRDLLEALYDFNESFADKINARYNLDIEGDYAVLLDLIPTISKAIIVVFNRQIRKSKFKIINFQEEIRSGRSKKKINKPQTQEVEATDTYLTGASTNKTKKIKVYVKK